MKTNIILIVVFLSLVSRSVAQPAKEEIAQQLRDLVRDFHNAGNAGDIDKVIGHLDEGVIVTWPNGKVSKGPAEVKAFFEAMTKGPNRVIEKFTINPSADDLSLVYNEGKTAAVYGKSRDYCKLADETEFELDTRWSATLIKKKDGWKVVSLHLSADPFDNPYQNLIKRNAVKGVGTIAGIAGLLAGLAIAMLGFKKPARTF